MEQISSCLFRKEDAINFIKMIKKEKINLFYSISAAEYGTIDEI